MNDLQIDDIKTDENAAMVLLVDDQAMIGEAVRRGLAHEDNIDFHFCADPHQAIAQAIRIKPTVILQDLVMPGLDGLTLVREYRNHPATQNIPIIVLSTKEDPMIKSAAFAAGANDYLVKLPDNIELVARIRYHSRSYMTLLQRDAAYRALRVSQQQLLDTNLVLQRLMNSDGLTGLSNRRHFDEYLELEWRRAMRDQTQLSLLMIDVDFFKTYNDSFGHVEGDEALRKVAAAIREASSRPSDLPARYGGEEFALVLPNTSPGGARLVAEKLRMAVAALKIPHIAPAEGAGLTISIGLSTMTPVQGTDCRKLIMAADKGLYTAKNNGRNQVGIE
ncbi:PleD family two-component system response regulator [Pseudomonas extremaustralis]|jgi:two-component system, chemotaxis family, response regulator WspR|uniref:diguanylate cyclase n=1 Tax=Pseudomonas extremaustralis TaxID=359110 RepID=A0A5C5QMM7_9PSED|nr:PleD family two-component system response regulator [Pseudomonas extremaustralis]EZI29276.1 diguanylate cyclase [Pseudomonas extremaustralis 14-3 substr. 14-3b]MDB1113091.1 PleD family two-component system response regulator [Pseudomonas extremaustralis]MDF3131565.1 PleD family two-component system response regulator [Pseudomonas extremaustralis]MDG2968488.1 PleD family two-component system response regulator [Pseudomonas extremaustralis]MDY7064796.1 Protein-glutamate methylesterase/protein